MEIDNTNISNMVASSISKLNLNVANSSSISKKPQQKKQEQNFVQESEKDDVKLTNEDETSKSPIDVKDVQKYAKLIGEDVTVDEIRYGLMYGRSVIADYSA